MPDPAKILAELQAGGRTARDRRSGARRAALRVQRAAAGTERPDSGRTNFPAYNAETQRRRPTWWWWPIPTSWPTGSGCASADFFGQQTALPFSDNGPFVANLVDTLAGGDALIGLRRAAIPAVRSRWSNAMQSEAEAKFRQTEQAWQRIWMTCRSNCRRCGRGAAPSDTEQAANAQAVITPAQRAAIDAARQGHRRDAAEAARGAVRPEPRHLASGERAARVRHRGGAGGADDPGDRAGMVRRRQRARARA